MANNSGFEQKIIDIVAEQLGLEGSDKAEIHASTTLGDDLAADSLDLVEIIMAIEDEYGVEIPDEAYEGDSTKVTIAHLVKVAGEYIVKREEPPQAASTNDELGDKIYKAYDRWGKENEGCGESYTYEDIFGHGYRAALEDQ